MSFNFFYLRRTASFNFYHIPYSMWDFFKNSRAYWQFNGKNRIYYFEIEQFILRKKGPVLHLIGWFLNNYFYRWVIWTLRPLWFTISARWDTEFSGSFMFRSRIAPRITSQKEVRVNLIHIDNFNCTVVYYLVKYLKPCIPTVLFLAFLCSWINLQHFFTGT